MSRKQNIKETILLLCNIINYHLRTKLTPETLRLAKFDKDEATESMWLLLFQINQFLNNHNVSFNGVSCLPTPEKKEDMVLLTKHELYVKGYCVKDFFSLPNDMTKGSRDILLAFGWLICERHFLRLLVDSCSNMLQECFPIHEEPPTKPVPLLKSVGHTFQNSLSDKLPSLDTLLWLLGNLKLGCNGLYSAENNLISLVNKVHCATNGTEHKKTHLSVLEVFLLRHPKELVKFQEKLERYNLYLESLLKFVECQSVFWKWLKSVYEAKLLERNTDKENNYSLKTSRCVSCREKATKQSQNLLKTHSEVQSLFSIGSVYYQKACQVLESSKNYNDEESKSGELLDLNETLSSLSLNESQEFPRSQVHTFPEFRQLGRSLTSSTKTSEPSCAKQAINLLKLELSQLETELLEFKNLHFKTLNDLAGNVQELVCIPPIESSKYFELKNKYCGYTE